MSNHGTKSKSQLQNIEYITNLTRKQTNKKLSQFNLAREYHFFYCVKSVQKSTVIRYQLKFNDKFIYVCKKSV